jgi:hypothetical protein
MSYGELDPKPTKRQRARPGPRPSGSALSEFEIENANAGFVRRLGAGFTDTGETDWEFLTRAGYFVDQDVVSGSGITAVAASKTFQITGGLRWPTHLVEGDEFSVGASDPENRGPHRVVSFNATSITVDGPLVDGAVHRLDFRNLPGVLARAVQTWAWRLGMRPEGPVSNMAEFHELLAMDNTSYDLIRRLIGQYR